jgi:hypothetical protein
MSRKFKCRLRETPISQLLKSPTKKTSFALGAFNEIVNLWHIAEIEKAGRDNPAILSRYISSNDG